jgi:hypothetical protein
VLGETSERNPQTGGENSIIFFYVLSQTWPFSSKSGWRRLSCIISSKTCRGVRFRIYHTSDEDLEL